VSKKNTFPTVPLQDVPSPGSVENNEPYRPVVMVVDDESSMADTIAEIQSRSGYAEVRASDVKGAR